MATGFSQSPQSSTNDLWDLTQGTVVTGAVGLMEDLIREIFLGGLYSSIALASVIFNDWPASRFCTFTSSGRLRAGHGWWFRYFCRGRRASFEQSREFEAIRTQGKIKSQRPGL